MGLRFCTSVYDKTLRGSHAAWWFKMSASSSRFSSVYPPGSFPKLPQPSVYPQVKHKTSQTEPLVSPSPMPVPKAATPFFPELRPKA